MGFIKAEAIKQAKVLFSPFLASLTHRAFKGQLKVARTRGKKSMCHMLLCIKVVSVSGWGGKNASRPKCGQAHSSPPSPCSSSGFKEWPTSLDHLAFFPASRCYLWSGLVKSGAHCTLRYESPCWSGHSAPAFGFQKQPVRCWQALLCVLI